MTKQKKILLICGISADVLITLFLFIVSIIMLATMPSDVDREIMKHSSYVPKNFIEYFQLNPTIYLIVGVIPLFLLLAGNIVGLMVYVKKSNEKKKVALNELTAEQKEALRQELLKDLTKDKQE